MVGRVAQAGLVLRVAEEVVEQLLELSQGRPQLAHHAAHGLAVADTAVQLLHPGFQRLSLSALAHAVEPLGQPRGARGQLRIRRVKVFERGFEVEDGSCHFHCQLGPGRACGPRHTIDRGIERLRQPTARRMQFDQRIGHQVELLGDVLDLVGVAAGQRRPGFLGGADPLARLREQHRVETPELAGLVVHRLEPCQAPRQPHGRQRRCIGSASRNGLRTEKHQVLRQPVRDHHFALGQGGVLHQDPGRGPLHVDVHRQQALGQRLEKAGGDLPEHLGLAHGLRRGEAKTERDQVARRLAVAALDQREHALVHAAAPGRVVDQGLGHGRRLRLDPAPVQRPQVGRVDPVGARQLLRVAVLREQGDRRNRLAEQQSFEVFGQRKAGALELGGSRLAAQLRPLDKLLHRRFHAAQHVGRRAHPHHFEGADSLVQLLAGDAQLAVVNRCHVRAAGEVGIADKTAQGGRSGVQRLAQLVQHPRQRAKVICCQVQVGFVDLHGASGSDGCRMNGKLAAPFRRS